VGVLGVPKEISIETLFQNANKQYLAIVFFTIQFANEIKWFRLYHYRYALQNNHNIHLSFARRHIPAIFNRMLEDDYKNPYSLIKKCFNSRTNLIDHLNRLVKINILEKKKIYGEYHYRLDKKYVGKLFYSYNCAWLDAMKMKVPHDLLQKIKTHIESEFKGELKKYNAFFYTL